MMELYIMWSNKNQNAFFFFNVVRGILQNLY